jgi:osmoprotectant transport system ATP-binding protein
MDEPFGAVDPVTRKQLQRELRRIQAEVRKTIVFVTHDITEAFLLGDRIVLMAEGRIVQNGTPADLLRRPAAPFVTQFIGEERGLRAFQYTALAEIAGPAPAPPPDGAFALPGALTILETARRLGESANGAADGFWVVDDGGRPSGYVTYQRFAAVLGETIAGPAEGEERHALPA